MRRYAGSTGRTAQGEWVLLLILGVEGRVVGVFLHWGVQLWSGFLHAATFLT